MQQLIDAMTTVPVFVQNGRLDAVATNRLGAALFSEMFVAPQRPDERRPVHVPRPPRPDLLPRLGRQRPPDRRPASRRGRPCTRTTGSSPISSASSPPAATCSAPGGPPTTSASTAPAPRASTTPIVGDLDLTFEAMDLTSDPGLQLLAFSAAPGSACHDGLQLLATWAATQDTDPATANATTNTDATERS